MPSRHLSRRAEQALVDVPSRHSAKQGQALATVKVVEWFAQYGFAQAQGVSPNEYWLAQRPLSTGSPNLV